MCFLYNIRLLIIHSFKFKIFIITLRFYDEIELLKPARYGHNAYRYYDEEQLLLLQQILFFRELGFPLKDIKRFMSHPGFNKIETLASHKVSLQKSLNKTAMLIKTIEKTISHLQGENIMQAENLYDGLHSNLKNVFDEYSNSFMQFYSDNGMSEQDLQILNETQEKIKNWSMDEFEKINQDSRDLMKKFVGLIEKQAHIDSCETQALVAKHHTWFKQINGNLSKPAYFIVLSHSKSSNKAKNFYQEFHPELMD